MKRKWILTTVYVHLDPTVWIWIPWAFSSRKSINYISALIIWIKISISVEGILWRIQRLSLIFYLAIVNIRNTSEIPELICPWNSPGKNTRVGCRFLLQGNLPTQGSNLGLLHCRHSLYCLSHQESPNIRNTLEIPEFSFQFSRSVVSDSLQPQELQHARPPCTSTPGVHSNSHPSSRWCRPAISSSVIPFSSCLQSLPASESFPMSQLFPWGGQSTGVSASTSVLPKNTQDRSPFEWTGWISLQSKGLSESSPIPQFKSIYSSALSLLHSPTLTSIHNTL